MLSFLVFLLTLLVIVTTVLSTASEMTYTVSGGALNSTQSNPAVLSLQRSLCWQASQYWDL